MTTEQTFEAVLWILSALCFALGALGVVLRLGDATVGWTDAGLAFAAIAIAYTATR